MSTRSTSQGRASIQVLGASALFALALGTVGPTLDGEPYGTPAPTQDARADTARLERMAAEHCQQAAGENAGWMRTGRPGEIACTDKHGRRPRHVITIYHRVEDRP